MADRREHRMPARHPLEIRRTGVIAVVGVVVAAAVLPFVTWAVAVVIGWDAAALAFLVSIWPMIRWADAAHTERLAKREDEP